MFQNTLGWFLFAVFSGPILSLLTVGKILADEDGLADSIVTVIG